jgi:hypothetical protein
MDPGTIPSPPEPSPGATAATEQLLAGLEAISRERPDRVLRLQGTLRPLPVEGSREPGEDPDAIDEELGPAIDEQPDPFTSAGSAPTSKSTASKRLAVRRLLQAPKVDPELYELEQ